VLLAGCGAGDLEEQQPLLLDATVAFPSDTVRFSLSAITHRCAEPRTLLIEATGPEGNGVLVRLHYPDSVVSRAYRVVPPGDTISGTAAVVVRYLVRETTRQFAFDSGSVQVAERGGKISGQIHGTGVESAIRTPSRIQYHDIALPAESDTAVSCAFQP
jgi:hypothetical protein